ncbi:MAG: trimethylamine methyltransferase family protein, partial [Desulfovibrionales bacterium]|nr:trimethylamine methyltransferase family protein [Desulfovibrionales bacterium]
VVLDAELATMTRRYLKPISFTDDTMALDLIQTVGPGGHFVTQAHTLKYCRCEYMVPDVFQRESYETWSKKGQPSSLSIAAKRVDKLISTYEKPHLDPELERDLDAYMAKTYGL